MSAGVYADRLTPAERLDEVAAILAAGIIRLRRKHEPPSATEEQVRLDFPPERSVHAAPLAHRRRSK
jgi:hypothetical protein